MKSRMEKYRRYRAQIAATPFEKFPQREGPFRKMTHADMEDAYNALRPEDAYRMEKERKRPTPYIEYLKREKTLLILKFVLLGLAIVGMLLLYIFFVKGV